jgi:hypothetical protein
MGGGIMKEYKVDSDGDTHVIMDLPVFNRVGLVNDTGLRIFAEIDEVVVDDINVLTIKLTRKDVKEE